MGSFGMMMRLALTVCAGTIVSPALVYASPADDAAAVRAQFTDKQWSVMQSVQFTPLVLPAYVPPGFSVSDVKLDGHNGHEFGEILYVTYARGENTIHWRIANYTGGADVPPNQFQYSYHSPVIGDGVVRTDDTHCWYTDNLTGPNNGLFGPKGGVNPQFYFELKSCKESTAPGELARMAQSVVLVRHGTVLRFRGNPYAGEATLTAPPGSDVRIFASLDAACGNANAQSAGATRAPSMSVKAGTHVYLLSLATSGCQGHSAQVPVPPGRWVSIAVPQGGWLDTWVARSTDLHRN
jgi:hypothetical protein